MKVYFCFCCVFSFNSSYHFIFNHFNIISLSWSFILPCHETRQKGNIQIFFCPCLFIYIYICVCVCMYCIYAYIVYMYMYACIYIYTILWWKVGMCTVDIQALLKHDPFHFIVGIQSSDICQLDSGWLISVYFSIGYKECRKTQQNKSPKWNAVFCSEWWSCFPFNTKT